MATKTTNYNLTKPDYNDNADIGVINDNMDIIDAKMKEIEDAGGGSTITIDAELSTESENPVQNKVITNKISELNSNLNNVNNFIPKGAINNPVGDCLSITTDLNFNYGDYNGYVASEGSDITDAPVKGTFYAYREVKKIPNVSQDGSVRHGCKVLVTLYEAYPQPCRIWLNVYNTDTQAWSGWTEISKKDDLNGVRKEVKVFNMSSSSAIKPNESISLDISDIIFNFVEICYYSGWNGVRNTVLIPKGSANFFVPISDSGNGYASTSISDGNLVIANKTSVNIVANRVALFNL